MAGGTYAKFHFTIRSKASLGQQSKSNNNSNSKSKSPGEGTNRSLTQTDSCTQQSLPEKAKVLQTVLTKPTSS